MGTISMISGTGLSIVRYGGLNVAPPHVGAIFWTLIAFMSWWAATDLTTQGTAKEAVEVMFARYKEGEEGLETPKVVTDRHFSNVVSCFCILSWCSNRAPSSLGLGRVGFKIVPRSLGSACAVSGMGAQTTGDMAIEYILMLCRQIGRLGSWIVGLRYALFASTP